MSSEFFEVGFIRCYRVPTEYSVHGSIYDRNGSHQRCIHFRSIILEKLVFVGLPITRLISLKDPMSEEQNCRSLHHFGRNRRCLSLGIVWCTGPSDELPVHLSLQGYDLPSSVRLSLPRGTERTISQYLCLSNMFKPRGLATPRPPTHYFQPLG
jgi:hypothetical protein